MVKHNSVFNFSCDLENEWRSSKQIWTSMKGDTGYHQKKRKFMKKTTAPTKNQGNTKVTTAPLWQYDINFTNMGKKKAYTAEELQWEVALPKYNPSLVSSNAG